MIGPFIYFVNLHCPLSHSPPFWSQETLESLQSLHGNISKPLIVFITNFSFPALLFLLQMPEMGLLTFFQMKQYLGPLYTLPVHFSCILISCFSLVNTTIGWAMVFISLYVTKYFSREWLVPLESSAHCLCSPSLYPQLSLPFSLPCGVSFAVVVTEHT